MTRTCASLCSILLLLAGARQTTEAQQAPQAKRPWWSTDGCIIDPRPKPKLPGGDGVVSIAKNITSNANSVVQLLYYQAQAGGRMRVDVEFTPQNAADALFVVPYGLLPKKKIELKQSATIWLYPDGGQLYLQVGNEKIPTGKSGTLDPTLGFDRESVSLSKRGGNNDWIEVSLEVFGVETGLGLKRRRLVTQPPWLIGGTLHDEDRWALIRPATTPALTEMYQLLNYHYTYGPSLPSERALSYEMYVRDDDDKKYKVWNLATTKSSQPLPKGVNVIEIGIDPKSGNVVLRVGGVVIDDLGRPRGDYWAPRLFQAPRKRADINNQDAVSVEMTVFGLETGFILNAPWIRAEPAWIYQREHPTP